MILNKHSNSIQGISDRFAPGKDSLGEIVICNDDNNPGICIKTVDGEVAFLGKSLKVKSKVETGNKFDLKAEIENGKLTITLQIPEDLAK